MSVATAEAAETLLGILAARRSTRRLAAGTFTERFFADLRAAAALTPSAFNSQPWRVVALRERNGAFWDLVEGTIGARLDSDRRGRYLARAAGMRGGGMTILVFEDLARAAPRDGVLPADARDHAAQRLGMLQLALWLVITAHGLATSLQHWHAFLEEAALAFADLPPQGFRLVALMPVGVPAEAAPERPEGPGLLSVE